MTSQSLPRFEDQSHTKGVRTQQGLTCFTSHCMGCFAWDSHWNDIPMDRPVFLIYATNHNRFVSKFVGFYF